MKNRALLNLEKISTACQYSSVSEFITENAELVVNSVFIKIQHIHRHPKAILVVTALLKHLPSEKFFVLQRLIQALLEKIDEFHHVAALPFVVVLGTIVRRLHQWHSKPVELIRIQSDPIKEAVSYLNPGCEGNSDENGDNRSEYVSGETEGNEEQSDLLKDEDQKEETVPEFVKTTVEVILCENIAVFY